MERQQRVADMQPLQSRTALDVARAEGYAVADVRSAQASGPVRIDTRSNTERMPIMRMILAGCFVLGMAGGIEAVSAQGHGRADGYVVAESRFGGGRVRGAVRQTSLGRQVQLPSGNWVYCKRSCSETLRAETVDFWEAQEGPGGKEQGLFIYLWPRR